MANDLGYAALANRSYKDPTTVGWAQQLQDNITAISMLLTDYDHDLELYVNTAGWPVVTTGSIMIAGKMRRNTVELTATWAMTGGNTIAETSSTGYYIWAYASGTTSTFEIAFNQTAASMTGNANSVLIGWIWNDQAQNITRCVNTSNPIPEIMHYGTSESAAVPRRSTQFKMAYGVQTMANNAAINIVNLPFTTSTSFMVFLQGDLTSTTWDVQPIVTKLDGASFTLKNRDGDGGNVIITWMAMGI